MSDVQAALGCAQLADLHTRLERRRRNHTRLRAALGDALFAVPGAEAPLHNIVFTSVPDRLIDALHARGIAATRNYCTLGEHPAYAQFAGANLPGAQYWASRAVYLPFGTALSESDVDRIATAVLDSGVELDTPPRHGRAEPQQIPQIARSR